MSSFFRGLEERKISRLFVYFSSLKSSFFGVGATGDRIREKGSGIGASTNMPNTTPYFLIRALCLQAFL